MDNIDPVLLANYQTKQWTFDYFSKESLDGVSIVSREMLNWFRELRGRLIPREQQCPNASLKTKQEHLVEQIKSSCVKINTPVDCSSSQSDIDNDDQATSLKYGIVVLSKLGHMAGLWIPSFALDISFDLRISTLFAVFSYCQLCFFFLIGLVTAKFVLEPSLVHILERIAKSVTTLFTMTVLISELGYLLYGLFTCAYIQYHRHFIQDFFLYRCTMIYLPRRTQRRQLVLLFVILYLFAFSSEPLYALLSLYFDLQQPYIWAGLSRRAFVVAKVATVAITSIGASLLSSCGILIPLITCFLMMATARHLKDTLSKQLARYRRVASAACLGKSCRCNKDGSRAPSGRLEALLDKRARKLMVDYSCETLTMDWPRLMPDVSGGRPLLAGEPEPLSESKARPHNSSYSQSRPSSSSAPTSSPSSASQQVRRPAPAYVVTQLQLSTTASSLLFLFKNLLKNLSELKQMIRLFETRFANFHMTYTLINCLIVAQWLTLAFTEARGQRATEARPNRLGQLANESSGRRETTGTFDDLYGSPFVIRIIGGVLTFIGSNIYIMMRCDCLARRLAKIKSQLFMMNIELACACMSSIASDADQLARGPRTSSITLAINQNKLDQQQLGPLTSSRCPEIDQIWAFYDQVSRFAATALFKFSSDTYYTKRCLLVIFGRSVSILLLFIQIIEMYSYS